MDSTEMDVDSAAMAAAMGFSSFGSQHKQPEHDHEHNRNKRRKLSPPANGANNVPLGRRAPAANPRVAVANEDEIALDDDEDLEDGGVAVTTNAATASDGPRYIDTSQPPPLEEAARCQDSTPAGGGYGLPQRPPPSVASSMSDHAGYNRGRRPGEHNPLWYVGYYDPSFNENPWAKLEAARGLPSMGTWIAREQRA